MESVVSLLESKTGIVNLHLTQFSLEHLGAYSVFCSKFASSEQSCNVGKVIIFSKAVILNSSGSLQRKSNKFFDEVTKFLKNFGLRKFSWKIHNIVRNQRLLSTWLTTNGVDDDLVVQNYAKRNKPINASYLNNTLSSTHCILFEN